MDNRATQITIIWIRNDEWLQDKVAKINTVGRLQEYITGLRDDKLEPNGYFYDLLGYALSLVDWDMVYQETRTVESEL